MRASQEGSRCGCVNLPRVKTSARIVSVARSTQNKQVPSQRSKDGSDDCTKDEALIDIRPPQKTTTSVVELASGLINSMYFWMFVNTGLAASAMTSASASDASQTRFQQPYSYSHQRSLSSISDCRFISSWNWGIQNYWTLTFPATVSYEFYRSTEIAATPENRILPISSGTQGPRQNSTRARNCQKARLDITAITRKHVLI